MQLELLLCRQNGNKVKGIYIIIYCDPSSNGWLGIVDFERVDWG